MDQPITLTFLGAAGTVTGSRFLLDSGSRVLLDCGLFQGDREWRRRNWEPLPVDPASIDAVVLTHAHLDHCGYLPRLVREGFAGPVVTTVDTARLAAIVLRDAAHLQEEDARWARQAGFSRHDPPLPLFDTADAEQAIARFAPAPRHQELPVAGDVTVELRRAGHILGSSFLRVSCRGRRLVVSGDMGRADHPLLRPPDPPGEADHVVVESTYGGRSHVGGAADELAHVLSRTLARGGVALIPAFAIDRTAMVLHEIAGLVATGRVPDVPVYADSPMALEALEVYRTSLADRTEDFRPELVHHGDPFDPGRLRLMRTVEQSEQLNNPGHPCIVVSASGMATGGRVLHHLASQLPHERNTVVLTGYQVVGTRGRALVDGAREVKIHGRYVPVRAEIANVRGFSAHADVDQLVDWLRPMPPPQTAFAVHGEPASSAALVDRLHDELGWTAVAPRYLERVRLS
jgi:metallo-beta-lactamase family protein